jgi:hypothetical protein
MNQQTTPTLPSLANLQVNHGDHHRIALGDYHESSTPDSIKMYLATTPAARIDEESIDNEFLFRHRFGFDVNRTGRAQVIALKTQYQMTDEEFISLRHSGLLSVKRTEIKISPDRWVPMVGWIYLGIISVYLLPSLLIIAVGSVPHWKQYLGMLIVWSVWLAAIWFICKTHLHPWRLLKQVGALQATGNPRV